MVRASLANNLIGVITQCFHKNTQNKASQKSNHFIFNYVNYILENKIVVFLTDLTLSIINMT